MFFFLSSLSGDETKNDKIHAPALQGHVFSEGAEGHTDWLHRPKHNKEQQKGKIQVGRVLVPLNRFFGVEAGCGARVEGFTDAGTLAPAAGTGPPGGLEGGQDSRHDAEAEESRRPG